MARTIGGMPVNEVFAKLKGEIPNVVCYNDKGEPYLHVNTMRNFFDSCVPIQNYDFSVTDVRLETVGSRMCFTCTGTITVYDDEGSKVVSKSYTGSNNCIIQTSNQEAKDLAMDAKNAAVDARKGCIRLFGCGEAQIEQAKAEAKAKKGRGSAGKQQYSQGAAGQQGSVRQTNPPVQGQSGTVPPTGNRKFRIYCTDPAGVRDANQYYLIPVAFADYGHFRTNLLVWKNKIKPGTTDELLGRMKSINVFICSGKFEVYANEYRLVYNRIEQ